MNTSKKKKAFTLTELLVVIVIAGVLAAVALPKFNAVVETRRTGEAEELASAIRNEQERRCALDQSYTVNPSRVAVAGTTSAGQTFTKGSFKYELNGEGLIARRTDKAYALGMPSYKDGRMYCEGEYCDKLNKNYPSRAELLARADFRAAEECAAPIGEDGGQTACEQDPNSCECNPNQAKCCKEGKVWNGTKCVTPEPNPSCDNTHNEGDNEYKTCECGKAQASWHCGADTNYQWKLGAYSACAAKPAPDTKDCDQGTGTQTRSAVCKNDQWTYGDWDTSGCDTCKEIYGSSTAISNASLPSDTCDGDQINRFTCASKPSFRGTCTDVYKSSFDNYLTRENSWSTVSVRELADVPSPYAFQMYLASAAQTQVSAGQSQTVQTGNSSLQQSSVANKEDFTLDNNNALQSVSQQKFDAMCCEQFYPGSNDCKNYKSGCKPVKLDNLDCIGYAVTLPDGSEQIYLDEGESGVSYRSVTCCGK